MNENLSIRFGSLELSNPLVAVSGTFGYGFDYEPVIPPEIFGAIVVKGTSLEPWPGNPPPRIVETPAGMLNAIGLENPGVEVLVEEYLPRLAARDVRVIVNVVGKTVEEYVGVARRLQGIEGVDALELNVSCPNVKAGGMSFGTSPAAIDNLVGAVRAATDAPLIVKLTPNVTDIAEVARAAEEAGADAISLINTLLGMAIDVDAGKPVLANVVGGLSGPAVRPVALRCVYQVRAATSLPILGLGGVASAEDVIAFIMAGASAVGIGTALFADPLAPHRILSDLAAYRARYDEWPVGRAHL